MFFLRFLLLLFVFFVYPFIYLIIGFFMFYTGKVFRLNLIAFIGHRIVAYGSAPYFGAHRKWLARNCSWGDCSSCMCWTCSSYCAAGSTGCSSIRFSSRVRSFARSIVRGVPSFYSVKEKESDDD